MNERATSDGTRNTAEAAKRRVAQHFDDARESIETVAGEIQAPIAAAGALMIECLEQDGKLLLCGNGGSAADAIHMSSELLGRFVKDRRPLNAMALTTDTATITSVANDYAFDVVFARQIRGLGRAGDVLVAITTSGNSNSILEAIRAAQLNAMRVVLMSGRDGGTAAGLLAPGDVEIRVPLTATARIQEIHGIAIHCLCDLIDCRYQGEI